MTQWRKEVRLKDVFHDDEMAFEEKRDVIVRRLKKAFLGNEEAEEVISDLSYADDVEEFDDIWDVLYDIADRERVWISTF
jgi:hypothetical protein